MTHRLRQERPGLSVFACTLDGGNGPRVGASIGELCIPIHLDLNVLRLVRSGGGIGSNLHSGLSAQGGRIHHINREALEALHHTHRERAGKLIILGGQTVGRHLGVSHIVFHGNCRLTEGINIGCAHIFCN